MVNIFKKLSGILLIVLLGLPVKNQAQSSSLGNWLIYFANKPLNEKWNWHHAAQHRNYNALGDLEQLLLRTGIGYNLTENNNNVLFGYAFIHSQNYIDGMEDKERSDEHRIYQQFITLQKFGRLRLQHRYRFEQRWIEDQDFRLRFRYFLALNLALNKKEFTDKTFYLSAYNEIFLNNNQVVFDRNRLYGGLGYQLNRHLRFEIGHMTQFLNAFSRDQINLITFLNF
jgi:hypothetical protein